MKKRLIMIALAGGWLAALVSAQGAQDVKFYEPLKEPRIRQGVPSQKMLVVESRGNPNLKGKEAFGLLFKVFFSIQGARMAPPRARWLSPLDSPQENWVGLYALPLPEQVAELPAGSEGARIEVWNYGDVAEILHVGSYSEETPTVQRLMKFIQDQGCAIAGPHEEEYLKGPGMAASPADYWTIIRYQVKKK
jgi:hypothetical protein